MEGNNMFCTNCGSQFEDGNSFCPNCGSKVESVAQPIAEPAPVATPVEAAPVQATPVEAAPVVAAAVEAPAPQAVPVATPVEPVAPVQPVYAAPETPVSSEDAESKAKSILVMGIVSVALACTFWCSLIGIIFGGIGLSKAKKFIEEFGQLYGKAKVGKYLSLGGLIGGCVLTGITLFYVLIYGFAIISSLR